MDMYTCVCIRVGVCVPACRWLRIPVCCVIWYVCICVWVCVLGCVCVFTCVCVTFVFVYTFAVACVVVFTVGVHCVIVVQCCIYAELVFVFAVEIEFVRFTYRCICGYVVGAALSCAYMYIMYACV